MTRLSPLLPRYSALPHCPVTVARLWEGNSGREHKATGVPSAVTRPPNFQISPLKARAFWKKKKKEKKERKNHTSVAGLPLKQEPQQFLLLSPWTPEL